MGKLYKELERYNSQNYCPMHMPGHKRNTELLGNKLPYHIDITEIEGFDDLHHPEGMIKEIEEKAKRIYQSKRSFILINGSTCGILAGIRSVVKPHDKILVARNCHKSVYHAIELNFLEPTYLIPKINEVGIETCIEPEEIKEMLKKNSDIKLIVLTSPTYEGVISNIKEIVQIAHHYDIPVLIDEAHGAHLNYEEELKEYEALNAGADIVIQSLHKTLPAVTQTAIMHIQGDLVEENEIARQLAIFETSSPSYILISSVEECLTLLEEKGKELFQKYSKSLEEFYRETQKLEKLKVLGNVITKNQIYDKGKIVVITNGTNLTGKELAERLRKEYKIEVEMANTNYIIAMTSICDTRENFERMLAALKEVDKKIAKKEEKEINYTFQVPERRKLVNEAIQYPKMQWIDFREAEGRISKEYMWIYPPGIPIIVPGEVIDKEVIEKLENIIKADIEVRTTYQKFPNICVVKMGNIANP